MWNFISVLPLYLISYILFFQYELVYTIFESWKNDDYSECSDLYKNSCKFGGISLFIITTYMLMRY